MMYTTKPALEHRTTIHWLDDPGRANDPARHTVRPRMSAETILALIQWKNKLRGYNRSVYEENQIAEEQGLFNA